MSHDRPCPDCQNNEATAVSRRQFVTQVGTAAAVGAVVLPQLAKAEEKKPVPSETLVKKLFDSLTDEQKKQICFDWDYVDPERGLLRTRVANNWQITNKEKYNVISPFYTKDQQELIEAIFYGHEALQPMLDMQMEMKSALGKEKRAFSGPAKDGEMETKAVELATPLLQEVITTADTVTQTIINIR